jgi:hypothetical protein
MLTQSFGNADAFPLGSATFVLARPYPIAARRGDRTLEMFT